MPTATVGAADLNNGAAVYQRTCAACHDSGTANAPRLGDTAEWERRLRWPEFITNSRAINGYKGMPARGGNSSLSDQDVKDAVAFIRQRVKHPAQTPTKAAAKPAPRPAQTAAAVNQANSDYHTPPGDAEIPNDKYGDEVRLGKKIFTQTYRYARRYAGNDLTCANCHLDAGRRPNSAPMWAAYGMYPAYRQKNDRNNTLQERIQQCFRFSLDGIAPPLDAPEVRALVTYMHFLATGAPVGVNLPGRGYPQIANTGHDPSPSRGADVYKNKCARCHGDDGAGKARDGGGYEFPPLWGYGSYNKGAGMARDRTLAGFIQANMPFGQGGTLSDQEALDLAAFINQQLRPSDPRKGIIEGLFE